VRRYGDVGWVHTREYQTSLGIGVVNFDSLAVHSVDAVTENQDQRWKK
jgi:hypothetical protein